MLGRPYGGIGFLCKKTKGLTYRILPCESDQIMVLQVIINQKLVLCLLGVYLPYDNSTLIQTEAYIETFDYLQSIIDSLAGVPIVILGDTNTVLPESVYLKDKWYTQKPLKKRSFLLYEFVSQNNLCTATFMFEQKVKYTYKQGNKISYIDHIIIPNYMSDMVKDCVILHDALDNTSDHLAVSLTLKMDISTSIKPNNKADSNASSVHPHARWHDKCFQERYASVIEENLDKISIILNLKMLNIMLTVYMTSSLKPCILGLHPAVR